VGYPGPPVSSSGQQRAARPDGTEVMLSPEHAAARPASMLSPSGMQVQPAQFINGEYGNQQARQGADW